MVFRPLVMLLGLSLAAGCEREQRQPATEPLVQQEAKSVAPLPVAEPPLSRSELLLAFAQAASDYALGRSDERRQRQLDGKRFQLSLRFGCAGDELASRSVRFDAKTNVLRLQVSPELSSETPSVQALSLGGIEAVEGFWIRRPWLLEAECPRAQAEQQPPPASTPTGRSDQTTRPVEAPRFAVAQFYSATDTRTTRRDNRAYEVTKKLDNGTGMSSRGYDLVVSGRLKKLQDGRVVACSGHSPTKPPVCIASAQFDHVTILDPESGAALAEWSGS